ncbi:MAG: hypothetical protein JXR96_23550 [Deltaproteobacteria bacterium]|nr:hypothetical protein [Deltaproteobacteria bacterium]
MKKTQMVGIVLAGACLVIAVGCPKRTEHKKFSDESGSSLTTPAPRNTEKTESKSESLELAPLKIDRQLVKNSKVPQAKELLDKSKFEDLVMLIEPDEASGMAPADREALTDIYYHAAHRLRHRLHNVSFSSMFCERGLLLSSKHAGLLRLQADNYLHPDMKLVGGAEELANQLVEIDARDVENQYLRGRVAFEQAEYDVAIKWLERAAKDPGQSKISEEAYQLLGMAKAKRDEIRSALSMTRELEIMMKRAKSLAHNQVGPTPTPGADGSGQMAMQPGETADPAGGKIVLYMTQWCKYCRKTRELLKSLNVKFEERDIEKDQQALMGMMETAERLGVEVTGVPVLQIGNQLVVGYNPTLIENMINKIR